MVENMQSKILQFNSKIQVNVQKQVALNFMNIQIKVRIQNMDEELAISLT